MSKDLEFSPDTLMHIKNSKWVLSNMKTLTHLQVDMETFSNINSYIQNQDNKEEYLDEKFHMLDCTSFTHLDGLMQEPTHLDMDKAIVVNGFDNVIDTLKKYHILIYDKKVYNNYFGAKQSFFDSSHYGTFHQQMGYNLLTSKRITPEKWWPSQKFTKDWEIQNNLYKYVQLNFFESYFNPSFVKNKKILDLGCGVGFYSKKLLKNGANVVGIDPNEEYIQKAIDESNGIGTSDFRVGILDEGSDILGKDEKFDVIIISDMLLFYFCPPDPSSSSDPVKLLKLIRNYLKDDGILYITEPHSFFWLAPWLGDDTNPYTVLNEYSEKTYSVTPTLAQLTDAFDKASLSVKKIYEPLPSEECRDNYSTKAYHFAKKFPMWWVFILQKSR